MQSPNSSQTSPTLSRPKMLLIIGGSFAFAAVLYAIVVSIPVSEEQPESPIFISGLPQVTADDPNSYVKIEPFEADVDTLGLEQVTPDEAGILLAQNTAILSADESANAISKQTEAQAPAAGEVPPESPSPRPSFHKSNPGEPRPPVDQPLIAANPPAAPEAPVAVATSTPGKRMKPNALLVVPMTELPSRNNSKRKTAKRHSRHLVSSGQMDYFRYIENDPPLPQDGTDTFDPSKLRNGAPAKVEKEDAEAFAAWMTNTHQKAKRLRIEEQFRLPSRTETSNEKVWRVEDLPEKRADGASEKRPFGIITATKPDADAGKKLPVPDSADELSPAKSGIPLKKSQPGKSPLIQDGPDKPLFKR